MSESPELDDLGRPRRLTPLDRVIAYNNRHTTPQLTDAAWLIYLGSPYTHDDWDVRRERADAVSEVAACLMRAGHIVYSPIAHGHAVDGACGHTLPDTQAFWMRHCLRMMASCDELVVCTLPGWQASKGLTTEIEYAQAHDMPVRYVASNRPFELTYEVQA